MAFIKLTDTSGNPTWVRAEWITTIGSYRDDTLVNSCAVRETPDEILALLVPKVTDEMVTDEMIDAAMEAWSASHGGLSSSLRAAIEAALRVRGSE